MEHYLDFAATTPVCIPAADAAYSAMIEHYGNPSSLYRLGLDAENRVAIARKTIARALNCEPDCLYFTGSATEANNLAVLGSTAANPRKGKKVVTTAIEHAAVLGPFEELGRRGYQTVFLKPEENGNYSPKQFYDAVDENTALVSVMLVNNEVGTRLPVEEIIRAVRLKNPETLVHVDAVQGAFKLPFSIKTAGPDLLSVSGHKLYAPKGIGALYIRKKLRVTPLAIGGGQEHGIRPGTESVPLIEAFAAAVEWYLSHRQEHDETYKACNAHLRKRLSQMPGSADQHAGRRCAVYFEFLGGRNPFGNHAPLFGKPGRLRFQRFRMLQRGEKPRAESHGTFGQAGGHRHSSEFRCDDLARRH